MSDLLVMLLSYAKPVFWGVFLPLAFGPGATWWLNFRGERVSEARRLDDLLLQINSIGIQYPIVENPLFINGWAKKKRRTNDDVRYDNYCAIVFNFILRLSKHCRYNTKKIEDFVHVGEMVRSHERWWRHPDNAGVNREAYGEKFCALVDLYCSSHSKPEGRSKP